MGRDWTEGGKPIEKRKATDWTTKGPSRLWAVREGLEFDPANPVDETQFPEIWAAQRLLEPGNTLIRQVVDTVNNGIDALRR